MLNQNNNNNTNSLISMFNRQREFNIISGQTNQYITKRSHSLAQQLNIFKQQKPKLIKFNKLGDSKDKKNYQYTYNTYSTQQIVHSPGNKSASINIFQPSTMNYVSTNYNIINHKQQMQTSKILHKRNFTQKIPEVNRKSPLTGIIHAARLLAPNYHSDYATKENNRQFNNKKGFCDHVCEIQKGYAIGKYFRTLK